MKYLSLMPYQPVIDHQLKELSFDVVCLFKPGRTTIDLIRTSQSMGRKAVLFLASDNDLDGHVYKSSKKLSRKGEPGHACYLSLVEADKVVVQSEQQQQLLRERFGREGILIKNPIDMTQTNNKSVKMDHDYALWVGKADMMNKHPERCFALAAAFPDVKFVMIMNLRAASDYKHLESLMPENVINIEHVPFNEIEAYFRGARIFINTSNYEGFPNTFLQAGKYGVPIISYKVDPDGFINRFGCGFTAGKSMDKMIDNFRLLWTDQEIYNEISTKIRKYVQENHDLRKCSKVLNEVLEAVVFSSSDVI